MRQTGGIAGLVNSCVMNGNINTGYLNCTGDDATQGAHVGNVSLLSGENNYFDASVVVVQRLLVGPSRLLRPQHLRTRVGQGSRIVTQRL